MWAYHHADELCHYGILGMKWGVRRYRNSDGSLTPDGQKRFDKMSNDQLQKALHKQVKKERSKQSGWSNQWRWLNTIGENSKKALDKYSKDSEKYRNTPEYKSAMKKIKDLDRKAESGKIDLNEYDTEFEKIKKSVYKPELDSSVRYSNGKKYVNEFINSYGKEMNLGYLRDLGYDKKTAEYLNQRVMKASTKTLY